MNIALIGYRGSGKSCVAKYVASQLGWTAIDADELLQQTAGRSIREIFAQQGEEAFRDLESRILEQLLAGQRHVLALGGGVILRSANRQQLQQATVVWLRAPAEVLHQRISADTTTSERRPNLTSSGGLDEVRRLLAERTPFYRECADFTVKTEDKSPQQIASEIVSLIGPAIKDSEQS